MFKARDVMVPREKLEIVEVDEPIVKVAIKIINEGIGSVIVVNKDGELAGIVTKRDIIRAIMFEKLDPEKTSVERIMSRPLITIDADTPLDIVIDTMYKYSVSHLPVIEDNSLVGLVSDYDIVQVVRDLLDILANKQGM